MRGHCFTNVEDLSLSYGKWSNANPNLSYPAMQPFLREASIEDKYPVIEMGDELGMLIHDKLLIMRKVSPLLFEVFMKRFVSGQNPYRIYTDLGFSDQTYKKYIFAAKQSLWMMLSENKCIFIA